MQTFARSLVPPILLVLALVLAACQSGDDEPQSVIATEEAAPSAAASAAASAGDVEGEETSVFELEAGDCFSAQGESLETVLVVPCDTPHMYEAYHVFDHPATADEEYPGDQEMLEYADGECRGPFEDFVGVEYLESMYFITSVTPSEETWNGGDREIVCTLNHEDLEQLSTSAEGSGE